MKIELYKKQLKENIVAAMFDYMSEDEDCGYSKKDIHKCELLLSKYLDKLSNLANPTDELITEQVKKVVFALNKLNKKQIAV